MSDLILDVLKKALNEVGRYFSENELAYLALTSKVEQPIRDKIAFLLHKELINRGLYVSREWTKSTQEKKRGRRRRVDIAVLKLQNSYPLALIEFKAMYTFDIVRETGVAKEYKKNFKNDIEKCQEFANDKTEIYYVMLATHPTKTVDEKLGEVVKYWKDINKAYAKHDSSKKSIRKEGKDNVRTVKDYWSGRITQEPGEIKAGVVFDIQVHVVYWIIGPYHKEDTIKGEGDC